MKVSKIMSKDIVTVMMDSPLSEIKSIFEDTKFHHLIVIADGCLFGIISDRDLFKSLGPSIDSVAATTKDLAYLNKRAHQIMTRKPIYLNENDTVLEAIDIFNQNRISCIPIVNDNNKPVGIVSWRDIMRVLGEANQAQKEKQALADIEG